MMTLSLCPKCGCPPQFRVAIRKVKTVVWSDGKHLHEGSTKHTGKVLPGFDIEYECGGGHTWEVPVEGSNPSSPA